MSDDDSEQEPTATDREKFDNRKEREHRRMEDHGDLDDATAVDSGDHNVSVQPEDTKPSNADASSEVSLGEDENQLDIPQISVKYPSRLDVVEQTEDAPADRTVEVPQISLRSTDILDTRDFKATVLAEVDSEDVSVPQFTPDTTSWPTPAELDEHQLEGVERVLQVQIPQITVDRTNRIYPFDTFLEAVPNITTQAGDVPEQVTADELGEEEVLRGPAEHSAEAIDIFDERGSSDEWITGEWLDPLELLFGSGGIDIKSNTPIVVLVEKDDIVGIAETLVKRLYREKEGGEPNLKKFHTADQLADEERWMSANNQIFTAELSDKEWERVETDDEYCEKWRSIWRNRFDELFSGQRYGAIIFNHDRIPEPEVVPRSHHPPSLVELDSSISWEEIADVFWSSKHTKRAVTFSQLFDRDANGVAQDRWEQILQSADGQFALATNNDDGASDEHYALKVFIVKWLAEQLWANGREFTAYDDLSEIEDYREIEETIHTEQAVPVADGNPVKPDVIYESQVFEAEMFFDEADESGVISKLQQTVRKYEDSERKVDAINIVVDNLTCLLHMKDFAQFKRNHRPWEEDYADINIYTVDLSQEELVTVNKIVNDLTEISLR